MEETDRDHKKKSNLPPFPSCFMSPKSPDKLKLDRLTPSFDSSPTSIFPTPPCSEEKESISHFQSLASDEIPKLNLELDESDPEESIQQSLLRSPLMPEDRVIGRLIGIKSVDFISDLLAVNGNKICQRICSYLEPLELCRFASVNRTWRNFVTGDTTTNTRWKEFLRDRKSHCALRGKENYGVPSQWSSSNNLKGLPLKSIDINNPEKKSCKSAIVENHTSTPVCSHSVSQQTLKLRPCPRCVSPSNLSQAQDGHCQCQKCGLRFCSVCLRDSNHHQGETPCAGISYNSRKGLRLRSKKLNKDTIGTKKTKDRVRRL